MNNGFGCGMIAGDDSMPLCAGLMRLKQEHVALRQKMDAYFKRISTFQETAFTDVTAELQRIAEGVQAFAEELHPHSEREEKALFPVMANYIGREFGPIAVMEYEHEQGKLHLQQFHDHMQQIGGSVTREQAQAVLRHAADAYHVLRDHFTKEETVLFPMAERMLNAEEKQMLLEKVGA